ncbi:sulfurtransferase-like selenium metabolism protein YedF [Clostridium malenominatum]|uniref:Sulfurtransferase-like selenium metabolism protein YedF n=1 Tax=Clostridium malenominatum TaxID=1539 RepID=A0ABN1J292_9CLOT
MKFIDCTGLKCPMPVIQTKRFFDSIEEGVAEIIVDNEIAKNNIIKYSTNNGYSFEIKEEKEDFYKIIINKNGKSEEVKDYSKSITLVVADNKLGAGSEELGSILMRSYFFALTESNDLPKNIIFLNSGVNLTTEGSAVLESLKKLEEKGAAIYSCGTCLDYYNLKDKLQIGEISNMYDIVEKMNSSHNTIKI